MKDCKPARPPPCNRKMRANDSPLYQNPEKFLSVIGGLQYLTITRPDICYSVNQVAQNMHAPTLDHMQGTKRILRYIKGTVIHGIKFLKDNSFVQQNVCDNGIHRCRVG